MERPKILICLDNSLGAADTCKQFIKTDFIKTVIKTVSMFFITFYELMKYIISG